MAVNSSLSESSIPGLWISPSYRRKAIRTPDFWLEGKRINDATEGLWRVHDGLYDFSTFIHRHPGGSDWLSYTKGTDITEAFESHHVKESVRSHLKQYYVKPAIGPRFSPYTFHSDGFYRTLKRRAQPIITTVPTGAAKRSKMWLDIVMVTTMLTYILAATTSSYALGVLAGFLMNLTVTGAHNFLHLRDNLRMYYFDFSFMSCREWRITHALSHHMYPNTLLDIELCLNEQILQWMPLRKKSWLLRYGSWFYSPFFYAGLFFCAFFLSHSTLWDTFCLWIWIVGVSSFIFGFIGFNGAHHHPDIFHDGDAPRADRDFGLGQIDAVRDHVEFAHIPFIVLVSFGEHCLHHLFPTIDHTNLHHFYPVFHETCQEYGVKYEPLKFLQLCKGQFQLLAKNKPNPKPPGEVIN